jgi:anion-transporting  ArsA/GET3 family ATPase
MVKRLASSEERAAAILDSRLYAHLARVVAGMQEYTAAEALHDASTSGLYDLVVLDTPPSRNALEFLEAPRKLSLFLDERVVGVFLPGRRNPFVRAAAELVETVFSRVFGATFFAELQGFLGSFGGGLGGMREHSEAVRSLLLSDATTFVLVTSPEPAALAEARFFQKKILSLGLPFGGFVLNRSWAYTRGYASPESLTVADDAPMSVILAVRKLVQLADGERWRAERDRTLLARLRMDAGAGQAVATPHLGGAVEDLAGLAALARNLIRLDAG